MGLFYYRTRKPRRNAATGWCPKVVPTLGEGSSEAQNIGEGATEASEGQMAYYT
jgi:hypothetical protein